MYAFCQDMPEAQESDVRKIEELVGGKQYDGLIAHVSGPVEGGGWRMIDVWESEEQLARFREAHLLPAFQQVFGGLPPGPRDVRDVTGVF